MNHGTRLCGSLLSLLFCPLILVAMPCEAVVVLYEGDVMPSAFSQPFTDMDAGAVGTRSVSGGLLHFDVTSAAGSLNSVRNDAFLDSDDAVFQFRTRTTRIGVVSPGAIPGGVVQIRWGGDSGVMVFHMADNQLIMKGGGLAIHTVFSQTFSTEEFHTYTIAKDGNQSIRLYADAVLLADIPIANFDFAPGALSGWESFSNNPNSATDWDFFRYAIGADAFEQLPIATPLPATGALVLAGLLVLAFRQARERKTGIRDFRS